MITKKSIFISSSDTEREMNGVRADPTSFHYQTSKCSPKSCLADVRIDSSSSIVSLYGYSSCTDEDDSIVSESGVFEHPRKKARLFKKSVRFVDVNLCCNNKPINIIQVSDSVDFDEIKKLFWSREDLRRFQTEAKIMHATDSDIRDYVDVYHRARHHFVNSRTNLSIPLSSNEFHIFVDGLYDGWHGLESFSPTEQIRKRDVQKIVQSIVAAQKELKLADIAASLSAPSSAWAWVIGQAESQNARMDCENSLLMLRNGFEKV